MNEPELRLSTAAVAFLFISALFGAAFASGQEILKFFGSYGGIGKWGILLTTLLFMAFGQMTLRLSYEKQSQRLEDVISPVDHPLVKGFVSLVTGFCLVVIYIALMAAASVLFYEQLGIPRWTGGLLVGSLVMVTTIVGFEGISRIIPLVTPLMLILTLGACVLILAVTRPGPMGDYEAFQSPLAPNWIGAAMIYVAYNFIGAVPFLNTVACATALSTNARRGALIGAAGLGAAAFLLYSTLMSDLGQAGLYELPMIYLAGKIAPACRILYSVILMIAIYCASVNALYGATKNAGKGNRKKRIAAILLTGFGGYIVSLFGFSNVISYIFPIQGYFCIALLLCILISYVRWKISKKPEKPEAAFKENILESREKDDTIIN